MSLARPQNPSPQCFQNVNKFFRTRCREFYVDTPTERFIQYLCDMFNIGRFGNCTTGTVKTKRRVTGLKFNFNFDLCIVRNVKIYQKQNLTDLNYGGLSCSQQLTLYKPHLTALLRIPRLYHRYK